MRVNGRLLAIVVGLGIGVAGCASPPSADVDAAKASVDKAAATAGADQYAPESLKAAQDARAALDAELKAQDAKWVKSYDKAKQLAADARQAGDKATADAVAAKEKADALAKQKAAADAARAKARIAPVRVGGRIMEPKKIKDVKPVYPPMAQAARVSGVVTIEATIGEDGKVVDAKVLKSVPMLDQAALDAVKQWEYIPTLLNGVPIPVVMTVTISFTR